MLNLLRRLARVRPKFLGCGCASVVLSIVAAIIAIVVSRCMPSSDESATPPPVAAAADVEDQAAPRLLLGRVWFDKLPEKRTDTIDLWIFLGGGIGIHETGSSYRASFDIFEFERQGAKIDAKYFHDKKRFKTGFAVRRCDDHPPFSLCLTLNDLDGKKVELYGFSWDEEMEKAAPGSKAVLESAKARAATSIKD